MKKNKDYKNSRARRFAHDINLYERLIKKQPSPERYCVMLSLTEHSEHIFDAYLNNNLDLHPSEQKVFAKYIDVFATYQKDQLLQQLQSQVDFDVVQYIEQSNRSWWQKLFNIKVKEKKNDLTARQLRSKAKLYLKIAKKLGNGVYVSHKQYQKHLKLEDEAIKYAESFLDGKTVVNVQDIQALKEYFKAFSSCSYDGNVYEQAYRKLKEMPVEQFEKGSRKSWTTNFAENMAQKFQSFKALFKFSRPRALHTPHMRKPTKRALAKAAGVAGGLTLLASLTFLGAKFNKKIVEKNSHKTELKTQQKQSSDDGKTFIAGSVKQEKAQEYTSEQKIWQNFYETKNEILAGSLKLNASNLNEIIQQQVRKKIVDLPANTISEQLVYTHLIYKAYGLPSPIDAALNATQKLSNAQQKDIEKAVQTVGKNGVGVKKIALLYSQKRGVHLNRKSAFDRAAKKQQVQFIKNLKQVRALNH